MKDTRSLDKFKKRPLSWSSISSFEWSAREWAAKYIDGVKEKSSKEMEWGKEIGEKISADPLFLPALPRYSVFEKKLTSTIGEIKLIGYLDSFCPKTKSFHEYKTSSNPNKWTQDSAQKHGQILFYLFLIWKNYGIPPEDINCQLHYIPVREAGDFSMELSNEPIQSFTIKHNCSEVLDFAKYIEDIHKRMLAYIVKRSRIIS